MTPGSGTESEGDEATPREESAIDERRCVHFAKPDRSVSPVVGIVLLFGMVAVAATVLAITGLALVEDLETNAEAEQARACLEGASHDIETVLAVDSQESIPCEPDYRAEGSVTLTWFDDDPARGRTVTIDTLGAFEYRLTDRTLAYQSGGIFETRDGSASVLRAPNVGFDNSTLKLGFVELTRASTDDARVVARIDHEQSRSLTTAIENASSQGYETLRIEVTSAYHDAWYDHLTNTLTSDTRANVTVTHHESSERVVATIEDFFHAGPQFEVTDLEATRHVEYRATEELTVAANVTNTGTRPGNDTVEFAIDSDENYTATVSTGTLDPGETTTVLFDGVFGRGDVAAKGNDHNLSRYGEYEYTIETSNVTARGSFFLSHPNDAVYRLEDVDHETTRSTIDITADVTNIGSEATPRDVTVTLQGDHEDLPDPLAEWNEEITLDPWDDGTIDVTLNRSALPSGLNYTYTVSVNNPTDVCDWDGETNAKVCERQGTFDRPGRENPIDEIVIDEPSDVAVKLLGTEISAEWGYGDSWTKRWAPVTASAVVGDTRYRFLPNGSVAEIDYDDPHDTDPGEQMEDFNLNTFGTQETVYRHEESIEDGTVTIEATYWTCEDWSTVGSDEWNGRTYTHQECTDFGGPITVDVASGTVDADSGFVMTRSADRTELPAIEEGYDRQRNVTEVFTDGTEDVDVVDGELTLGANDFAFMLETTMDQSTLVDEYDHSYSGEYDLATDNRTELNLAAWDVAQHYRSKSRTETGDPNFNDVIGLVEVEPGERYFDGPNGVLLSFEIDGTAVDPDETLPEPDGGGTVDVGAGSGVVVIS